MQRTKHTPEVEAPAPQHGIAHSADSWGVHPFIATAVIAIDLMLFSGEVLSAGLLVVLSILVGAALVLPITLVQRYAYRDSWGLALGKGMLLGILTAVPTPLPSIITIGLGAAGLVALRHRAAEQSTAIAIRHQAAEPSNVIDIQN